MKQDIDSADLFTQIQGKPPLEALDGLAATAISKAILAGGWYKTSIRRKRRGALLTRLGAIILAGIATLVPTVLTMISEDNNGDLFRRWAPLGGALGITAAFLIMLDKFAGFSSGWMRYIAAYQDIQAKQEVFQLAWAKEHARLSTNTALTWNDAASSLDRVAEFLQAINDVVRQETQTWITEFKGALAQFDQSLADLRATGTATAVSLAKGAIEVMMAGAYSLDDRTWELQIDDRSPATTYKGATSGTVIVDPGLLKLRVRGRLAGQSWVVEKAVVVEPGRISRVDLSVNQA